MKNYLLIALSLICLLSACGKKKKFEAINGIQLRDEFNQDLGNLGNPSDFAVDVTLKLTAFPVPSSGNVLYLALDNLSEESQTFTIDLKAAYYKDAPRTISKDLVAFREELVGTKIKVENLNSDPKKSYMNKELAIDARKSEMLTFDVSHLSQGFYQVIVNSSKGQRYYLGVWIFRP